MDIETEIIGDSNRGIDLVIERQAGRDTDSEIKSENISKIWGGGEEQEWEEVVGSTLLHAKFTKFTGKRVRTFPPLPGPTFDQALPDSDKASSWSFCALI